MLRGLRDRMAEMLLKRHPQEEVSGEFSFFSIISMRSVRGLFCMCDVSPYGTIWPCLLAF
tara:strand:+ start:529 stop:708 length:180 start_codon:yes stop_codon:yes gene_type:complete